MIADTLLTYLVWAAQLTSRAVEWYLGHSRTIIDWMHLGLQEMFLIALYITTAVSLVYILLSVMSFFSPRTKEQAPLKPKEAVPVTVHIPTRNELAALNCAEKCLEQDYPAHLLDVVIGDDSDDPEVSRKLREFASKHKRVQVVARKTNTGYKPGNLNNMLKHTKGELVVVFDSDFLPGPDFVRRLVTPMIRDQNLQGVQSRWKPINTQANITTALASAINETFHQLAMPVMNRYFGTVVFCGSAEAVRVSTLKKLGGWKSGSFTEDIEYSLRLLKNGHKIAYLYDVTCELELPHTPKDLYKQQMRWAYGVISSIVEHLPDMLRGSAKSAKKTGAALGVTVLMWLGYLLSTMLLALITLGTLAFITHPIGPIDFQLFFSQTGWNILITSGLLVGTLVSFAKARQLKLYPRFLAAAFSVGIVTIYYVNKGIYRMLVGKDMQWYLLAKHGNRSQRT
jgi:cellulose synthase/poly-beta-1,6-N-acetylglucosamine synthase-like glycosyltransferase